MLLGAYVCNCSRVKPVHRPVINFAWEYECTYDIVESYRSWHCAGEVILWLLEEVGQWYLCFCIGNFSIAYRLWDGSHTSVQTSSGTVGFHKSGHLLRTRAQKSASILPNAPLIGNRGNVCFDTFSSCDWKDIRVIRPNPSYPNI